MDFTTNSISTTISNVKLAIKTFTSIVSNIFSLIPAPFGTILIFGISLILSIIIVKIAIVVVKVIGSIL